MAMGNSGLGIRRLGFRKWYERELIKSHGALVTCLLCGVTLAAMVETAQLDRPGAVLASALIATAVAALGWFSWRSYITRLRRAELYGEHSTCAACGSYGRFQVVATGAQHDRNDGADAWLQVECRGCAHRWRMPD